MSEPLEDLFQNGIQRYESGEAAKDLIPVFEEVCQGSPKAAAAWTCLSWLYLLEALPDKALKAAQIAVKQDPVDAQPRINQVLAQLELGKTGVRQQIDIVREILVRDPEQIDQVKANFETGSVRRPGWKFVTKVQSWIFD